MNSHSANMPLPSSRCVSRPSAPPSSPCPSRSTSRGSSSPSPTPLPCSMAFQLQAACPSLDSQRRHSWQPQPTLDHWPSQQRSVSLEGLDLEEFEGLLLGALRTSFSGNGRDPRRAPITSYDKELSSQLSFTEQEAGSDLQLFSPLELQAWSLSAPSLCASRRQLLTHTHPEYLQYPQYTKFYQYQQCQQQEPQPRQRSSSISNTYDSLLRYRSSSLSVEVELGEHWRPGERSIAADEERRTEAAKERPHGGVVEGGGGRTKSVGSPLGRTFSFIRKMAAQHKNKDKEKMKEREKEAREREGRYSNGHLFTSLTVSATTLCSSCNRSITAKEALSCPTCNVTIHNRCRDSLASCAKMKQRQQKLAMVRNSSALQNVALRTKTPLMKERPSSAIYPSDSLRQSFLGGRRVRSGLSLAKSVSTNNIAGADDSPVGLRRILSQSSDSLNFRARAMSMESLTDEGELYYSSLLEELASEGKCVEADSWSMAVEPSYLQSHRKETMKRQDVIYELIQTEFHHVRTLRIMEGVFRRGMLEEVMLEPGVVHAVFPCLDQLQGLHSRFLSLLLARRNQGLAPGSQTNFSINQLGDLLLQQFSGQCAEDMRKAYSEFCSRHPKAVKLYKELLAKDKRFQLFIRRVSRGPLLRRHGIQECILLVTQRITKYPVLIQRILDNTKSNEGEEHDLSSALVLLKELISSVDQEVLELERTQRLQEIRARMDPRAQAEVRGGGVFKGGELLRRRLLHEGNFLCKTQSSRMKDVQVLLMSDILVFLQEKDQKFIFPSLEKPAVVSLSNLIVREVANQERGMFLISDSSPPEMFELYAASKEDRKNWMTRIQQTVLSCPSREDFPLIETEDKALIRRLRAEIQQKDREVLELLQERVTLFSDLAEVMRAGRGEGGQNQRNASNSRNLFRADTNHAPQAERFLTEAISEVDRLTEMLLGSNFEFPQSRVTNSNQDHRTAPVSNGESVAVNGSYEVNTDSTAKDRNGNQLQDRVLNEELFQRLISLSTQLHALQAAVICQDSIMELGLRERLNANSTPSTPNSLPSTPLSSAPPRLSRSMSRDTGLDSGGGVGNSPGDAVLLQRQISLLQEEVMRLRARTQLEQKNRDLGERPTVDQTGRRRGSSELESRPLAPLASQEALEQLDGVQEGSEEEEEPDVVTISPRSESPRDLQDIPEESECGAEGRET